MSGEVIDKFRLEHRLGENHLGEVWQAGHVDTGAKVAIRLVRPELSALAASEATLDDIGKLSRVAHPNIAKIYLGGRHGNRVYVVTELVVGETLPKRIARLRMSSTQAADVIRQGADALIAAGVTHHALTSNNVFIVPDLERPGGERAVVVDFGLGRFVDAAPQCANLAYTAQPTPDDVYSLGCIGFEAATGQTPFVSKSSEELRLHHQNAPVPSAKSLAPDVIPSLEVLFHRMLTKTPATRVQLSGAAKMASQIVGAYAPTEATAMS